MDLRVSRLPPLANTTNVKQGPFAGLLLADAGADVLRIDRPIPGKTHTPGVTAPPGADFLTRRKSSIAVDLKSASGVELIKDLVKTADVVIDPFRPACSRN